MDYPDYCKDCETQVNVKSYRLKNIVQKGKYQGDYGKTIALDLCKSCLRNYLNNGWIIVD